MVNVYVKCQTIMLIKSKAFHSQITLLTDESYVKTQASHQWNIMLHVTALLEHFDLQDSLY